MKMGGGVDQFSICKGRHKVALSKHLAYGPTGAAILPSSVLLLFLFPSASSFSHSRPSFILPPSYPRLQEKGDDKCGGADDAFWSPQ